MARGGDLERIRSKYECKGRVSAQKGSRPAFCYRVRRERKPTGNVHVVQLVSRRTGKPIGFISTDFGFDRDRMKAHEWNADNKFAAGLFVPMAVDESTDRRPPYAGSRALVKAIDAAARTKTR